MDSGRVVAYPERIRIETCGSVRGSASRQQSIGDYKGVCRYLFLLVVQRPLLFNGSNLFGLVTETCAAISAIANICISFTAQLGRTCKCRAVACVYPRLVCGEGVIRTDL
jgi:hypothetical protein